MKKLLNPLFEVGDEVDMPAGDDNRYYGEIISLTRLFIQINEKTGKAKLNGGLRHFESDLPLISMPYELSGDILTVIYPPEYFDTRIAGRFKFIAFAQYYLVQTRYGQVLKTEDELLIYNQWAVNLVKNKKKFIHPELQQDVRGIIASTIWAIGIDESDDKRNGQYMMRFTYGSEEADPIYYKRKADAQHDLKILFTIKGSLQNIND